MKVIVRCPKNRVTKSEMEQIIESLFQENKDLRLSESHLRDQLNIVRQQSEARRQVICERDKLIQELNEEVQASNDELENVQCDLVDHVKLQEEMCDTIDNLRTKVANVSAERDNFEASYKQVIQWWGNEQTKAREAEAHAEEYRIALMESDCRVDELEKQLEWVRNKNEEWAQFAATQKDTIAAQKEEKEALEDIVRSFEETRKDYEEEIHAQHVEKREWMQKYEELKAQKEADDKKCEETCAACNERYEDVLAERNHLRGEVERLTYERNTAVNGNAELIEENVELRENLDAATNIRIEYAQEIDRLRKVVTNLQSTRFTTDEFLRMIARELMPSTGNNFADSVDF